LGRAPRPGMRRWIVREPLEKQKTRDYPHGGQQGLVGQECGRPGGPAMATSEAPETKKKKKKQRRGAATVAGAERAAGRRPWRWRDRGGGRAAFGGAMGHVRSLNYPMGRHGGQPKGAKFRGTERPKPIHPGGQDQQNAEWIADHSGLTVASIPAVDDGRLGAPTTRDRAARGRREARCPWRIEQGQRRPKCSRARCLSLRRALPGTGWAKDDERGGGLEDLAHDELRMAIEERRGEKKPRCRLASATGRSSPRRGHVRHLLPARETRGRAGMGAGAAADREQKTRGPIVVGGRPDEAKAGARAGAGGPRQLAGETTARPTDEGIGSAPGRRGDLGGGGRRPDFEAAE